MKERLRVSRVRERRRSRLNGRIYESTGFRVGALVFLANFSRYSSKEFGTTRCGLCLQGVPFKSHSFFPFFLIELIQRKNDFTLLAIIEWVRLLK